MNIPLTPYRLRGRRIFRRLTAGTVIFCLLANQAIPGAADIWSDRRQKNTRQLAELPLNVISPRFPTLPPVDRLSDVLEEPQNSNVDSLLKKFPYSLGSLRPVLRPLGKPRGIVVHIQDIHRNLEAQKNIAATIERLSEDGEADLIALEGAFQPVNLSAYRAFPDVKARKQTADQLLEDLFISGPIDAALKTTKAPAVVGIDDERLYRKNVLAVRQAGPLKSQEAAKLEAEGTALAALKAKAFPVALSQLDTAVEGYEQGIVPLGRYVEALASTGASQPRSVKAYLVALRMEAGLDLVRIDQDRAKLISQLSVRLDAASLAALLEKATAYRGGRLGPSSFYSFLRHLCAANKVPIEKFPALAYYLDYVSAVQEVNTEHLFADLGSFRKSAYNALRPDQIAKKLIEKTESWRLRSKLAQFSLTSEEWASWSNPVNAASPFEAFYRCAAERDRLMSRNLISEIDRLHAHSTVVVTGGFHAAGIDQALNRAGFIVLPFVPKITRVDLKESSAYLGVFSQEKMPLDRIFEGKKLFLAEEVLPPATRARLGLLMGAKAYLWNSVPVVRIISFWQQGLTLSAIGIQKLRNGVVHITGFFQVPSGAREVVAFDITNGRRIELAQPTVGVWDIWRPIFARLRQAVERGRAPVWTLVAAVAGFSALEELLARPILRLIAHWIPQISPPVTLAIAGLLYAIVYAAALHRLGLFAHRDEEGALTRRQRVELFAVAIGLGALQTALVNSPITAVLLAAFLSAAHSTIRFNRTVRPAITPLAPPVDSDERAREILLIPNNQFPARLPEFWSMLRWVHDHPALGYLDTLLKLTHRPYVKLNPDIAAAVRREIRFLRYQLTTKGGPSERVRLLVEQEQIIVSADRTLAEKEQAINTILANPGAADLAILTDALITYRLRHPKLALRLIAAIREVRRTGVLTPRQTVHDSLMGIARRAIEEAGGNWEVFTPVIRDSGQTLELRWKMPPGMRLENIDGIRHRLRQLFNEQNLRLDPGMTIQSDPTIPQDNSGVIRLSFKPDIANLSDFQRTMGVDDFVVGRQNRYRARTPFEMTDRIDERAKIYLDGLDADDPERAAFIAEVFGTANTPGMDASVRDIENLGAEPNVRIESYTQLDPNSGLSRAAQRSSVRKIKEMGDALPYLTHYIPEFAVGAWAFFGRSAAPLFTTASLKGFLRGHLEVRDHMVMVSRETVGWRHWNEIHNTIAQLLATMSGGHTLSIPTRNYRALRLVLFQWLRNRYMLAPPIRVAGMRGVMRYREASVGYKPDGRFSEELPIYDHEGPGGVRIGAIRRERDLSQNAPPEYTAVRIGDDTMEPWLAVGNDEVQTDGDKPDEGMYAHIVREIDQQFRSSPILNGRRSTDSDQPLLVTLVDETGFGSFDFLTAFALETQSHLDESFMPVPAELAALRSKDVSDLQPEEVVRWEQLEKEYLGARVLPSIRPVEALIFIAAPPNASSEVGFLSNEFDYLTVDPIPMSADYGIELMDTWTLIARTATSADHSPNLYHVDISALTAHGYRGQQRPDQPEFDMGAPILGQNIPIRLERPAIQIAAYLRDLYIYNGTVNYYESEYQRLSGQALILAASDGAPAIRGAAIGALAIHEFPQTLRKLIVASQSNPSLRQEAQSTAARMLRSLLRDAVEFGLDGNIRLLVNYEILHSHEKYLREVAQNSTGMIEVHQLALTALETLEEARHQGSILGVPLARYLALRTAQKQMLRNQGIYVIPLVSASEAEQTQEMRRAADPLGFQHWSVAPASWTPPSLAESDLSQHSGGVIPWLMRRILSSFVGLWTLLGMDAATAIVSYRQWGSVTIEEIFFSAIPVLIGWTAIAAGHSGFPVLLLVCGFFLALRIGFVFAHPVGHRTDAARIAALSILWMVAIPLLGPAQLPLILALAGGWPVLVHAAVNIVSDRNQSQEERLASRVAMALVLAQQGNRGQAREALLGLLRGIPISQDIEGAGNAFGLLSSALSNTGRFDGQAFAAALARALPAALGKAQLTEEEAGALIQRLIASDLLASNSESLDATLADLAGRDADLTPKFVNVIIDEAGLSQASALLKIALSRRKSANEFVLVSATSQSVADILKRRELDPHVAVVVSKPTKSATGLRKMKLNVLPARWNGAVPRALIVPEGLEIDFTDLPQNSPYRTAAIVFIDFALRAVSTPVDTLERAAHFLASQA